MLISNRVIGGNIHKLRIQASLTQEELAERVNPPTLHVGRIERGERPASLELLAQFAQALDAQLGDLLCGCTVRQSLLPAQDMDAHQLGLDIEDMAAGCSPEALELMAGICRLVAERDKTRE